MISIQPVQKCHRNPSHVDYHVFSYNLHSISLPFLTNVTRSNLESIIRHYPCVLHQNQNLPTESKRVDRTARCLMVEKLLPSQPSIANQLPYINSSDESAEPHHVHGHENSRRSPERLKKRTLEAARTRVSNPKSFQLRVATFVLLQHFFQLRHTFLRQCRSALRSAVAFRCQCAIRLL